MIAAVFDFDGTLVKAHVWQCLVRQQWRRRANVLPMAGYVGCHYALYPIARAGAINASAFRRLWARHLPWVVAGMRTERAARVFAAVVDQDLLPATRPEMLERLRWHQAQGHLTLILSGAFEPLLSTYAARLGLGHVAGTVLETRRGRYTGRIHGPLCYGEGKLTRLGQYFQENASSVDLAASYAYADSYSDLPILEAVGVPAVVAPDDELRRLAGARGWACL